MAPAYLAVGDGRILVTMLAVFDEPRAVSGDWLVAGCLHTRIASFEASFTNVTTIRVSVDLERREVVQFGVTAPYDPGGRQESVPTITVPRDSLHYTVTDLTNGFEYSWGNRIPDCPKGLEDD
jgi:hypothetical protein